MYNYILIFVTIKPVSYTSGFIAAHQPRPHSNQQEAVCLSLERVFTGGEALQGTVHAGCAHEETHWGKTSQVYRKLCLK